jgi:hypothetical protein
MKGGISPAFERTSVRARRFRLPWAAACNSIASFRHWKGETMKRSTIGTCLAIALGLLTSACGTTGTRVTSTSDTYKSMARSQQAWCSQFGCGCTLDGQAATCSLVEACLSSGNCQRAAQ